MNDTTAEQIGQLAKAAADLMQGAISNGTVYSAAMVREAEAILETIELMRASLASRWAPRTNMVGAGGNGAAVNA